MKSLELIGVKKKVTDNVIKKEIIKGKRHPLLPFVSIILLLATIALISMQPSLEWFVTSSGNIVSHSDNVIINATSSKYFVWTPQSREDGYLASLKVTGEFSGSGSARISLEDNNGNRYLIGSTNSPIGNNSVTGYLIKGSKSSMQKVEAIKSTSESKLGAKKVLIPIPKKVLPFVSLCEETCDLADKKMNYSSYKLFLEVNGSGKVVINQIDYSYILLKTSNLSKTENTTNMSNNTKVYHKIRDDKNFDVDISSTKWIDNNFVITFSQNANTSEPFFVIGNVTYGFSKNPAPPNENITLTIYDWNGSKFYLQVGNHSEIFVFEMPQIKTINNTNITTNENTTNETYNISSSNISLVNIAGKPLNAKIIVQNTSIKGEFTTMGIGILKRNVTIIPQDVPVKRMKLIGVNLFDNPKIVIDKINKTGRFSKMYIIDPTNTKFEKAEITSTAVGNVLFKCKTWNKTTETCDDPCNGTKCNISRWERVMNITPGENYTFTMTPEDPVYAEYNATTGAPKCESSTSPCIANSSLLKSRDSINVQSEPNAPNTIDSCTDGSSGTYQTDESIENITVTDLNGSTFNGGDTVQVDVWAYCYNDGSSDNINFVYTNNTDSPSWRVVGYINPCPAGGFQKVSKNFTLDDVRGYHTVRAIIQYSGSTSTTCGMGNYDDNDDLSFYVKSTNVPPDSLFFDDFESGSLSTKSWVVGGGSSANWTAGTGNPYEGIYDAEATNTGSDTYMINSINTSEYTNLTITFYKEVSIGSGASAEFKFDWYDGSSWHNLEDDTSDDGGNYVKKTFTLPAGAENNPNFKIRYICNSQAGGGLFGGDGICYLDYVTLIGKDTFPPKVTKVSPTNTTYTTSSIWFNVTATDRNGVDSCWYSLDGNSNVTLTKDGTTSFSKLSTVSDGTHQVVLYCNDTRSNVNTTSATYFTVDTTPPQWNSQSQNATIIPTGGSIKLSAHWTDNIQLSGAILSTNESGSWQNITTSSLSGTSGWNNFTWSNSSVTSGTTVAWKIYANDTAGNYNITNTMTFKVEDTCIVSLNTSTINFGTVAPGADTGGVNQAVNVTNGGNTQATSTTIKGNDWSDGTHTMPVGQTEWSTSTFTYGSGTALTASDAIVANNLGAGSNILIYFGLGIPAQQNAGSYTQTITISMNC